MTKAPLIAFTFLLSIVCPPLKAQLFQKAIGLESFEKASSIKPLTDGGFIVAGETESFGQDNRDMMLMRLDSNGNVVWTQSYGGPERETVNDVVPVMGGFLFTAEKYQPQKQEGENLTIIKTAESGSILWKKMFDEGGQETEGFSMQPTPDNSFVITGIVKSSSIISDAFFSMSAEDQGLYLLKIDGNGNKVWSRKFNYGSQNVSSTGTHVIVASDNTYLVTGNVAKVGKTDKKIEKPATTVNTDDVRNMLLLKVKPNGSLQWAKEYAGNTISMGYSAIETKGGGYLVTGNTNVNKKNIDVFLMSVDATGKVLWAKTYGGPLFESVADVVQTADGGFIVSAQTQSFGNGSLEILNFKVDNKGTVLWAKTYGGKNEDYPSRLALTKNGIVTAGATASFNAESFDVLVLKTDLNGGGSNISKTIPLAAVEMKISAGKIDKAALNKVEQAITPPNMKKIDVSNISEKKREVRVKNLSPK